MCAFNNPIVFNCGYMQLILFLNARFTGHITSYDKNI